MDRWNTIFTTKFQLKAALLYLLIAGCMGVLLRAFHIIDVPLEYKHLVHGHSHTALLGWCYLAVVTVIMELYFKEQIGSKSHQRITLLTHLSLIGMLLTFPFQGYAIGSIIFSTLFLFVTYWFTAFFVRNAKDDRLSTLLIKSAFVLLVISSAGPWSLGILMKTAGPESDWYRLAIYFYLHFLYNGAFTLFLVGFLFRLMENVGWKSTSSFNRSISVLFFFSCGFSFLLSALFANQHWYVFLPALIGAVAQLIFFVWVVIIVRKSGVWRGFERFNRGVLLLLFVFVLVKCILQVLSAFPYFVELTLRSIDTIVAYLHLVFLGIISLAILLYFRTFSLLKLPNGMIILFIFGVVFSEVLIVVRGFGIMSGWQSDQLSTITDVLPWVSAIIPLSIVWGIAANKLSKE